MRYMSCIKSISAMNRIDLRLSHMTLSSQLPHSTRKRRGLQENRLSKSADKLRQPVVSLVRCLYFVQ